MEAPRDWTKRGPTFEVVLTGLKGAKKCMES